MSSIREKAGWVCVAALSLLLIAALAGAIEGGPLDPESPPASSMKRLDQIEPRTPISSLPFSIDQPGSYYVTANLELEIAGTNGITVTAPYVTIDLNMFSLTGPGAGAGDGIAADNVDGVSVFGGTVSGWDDGVLLTGAGSAIEDVTAANNAGTGLTIGRGGTLRNSVSAANAIGIAAQDASVTDNRVYANAGNGIVVDSVNGAVIDRNDVTDNETFGIFLTADASFVRVADNTVGENFVGLNVHGTSNVIIRNVVRGNEIEHSINVDNTVAPFVTSLNASTAAYPFANMDN